MSTTQNPIIKKLIITDDDLDDQILLKEAIEDFEYVPAISILSDGCQLIAALQNDTQPDLVLLDLNMPNKNGIDCLMEIRANKAFNQLPIIIFSTSKDAHDIDAAYENGANLFFSKPCTFTGLKKLLHSILSINWEIFFNQKPTKEEFSEIAHKGEYATNKSST